MATSTFTTQLLSSDVREQNHRIMIILLRQPTDTTVCPSLSFRDKISKQVNMVLNVHRNHRAYQRRGEVGKGVWKWGEREIIYLSLHCHHQNDSGTKMGSDESHFNVSEGSDGQSHKTVSTNHNLFDEKGEPKRYRTEVLPLTSPTPYRQAKPAHGKQNNSRRASQAIFHLTKNASKFPLLGSVPSFFSRHKRRSCRNARQGPIPPRHV